MTEAEWLTLTDPAPMLDYLRSVASDRKLRLTACAVIRLAPFHPDGRTVWDLLPDYDWFRPSRPGSPWSAFTVHDAVARTEEDADGAAIVGEVEAARVVGSGVLWCAEADTPQYTDDPAPGCWPAYAAAKLVHEATHEPADRLRHRLLAYRQVFSEATVADLHPSNGDVACRLFRDVFGNPFRSVVLDPSWRTEAVVALAAGIYADRAFQRLPVLVDALEDAGCSHESILAHCRSAGPHVKGCWVVDLLLGRE